MATREKQSYRCKTCGHDSPRWFGRCPGCGDWSSAQDQSPLADDAAIVRSLVDGDPDLQRIPTGIDEVDRVLGGGIVPGEALLLGGEPGIGKSTLVLQLLEGLMDQQRSCLLTTGEESLSQVSLRALRLGLDRDRFRAAATQSLEAIVAAARRENPDVLVVDSVQTLATSANDGPPGSVAQVRECAAALTRVAKETSMAVVLVGHVTKDGSVAGPKTLEHLVDAVLILEGERTGSLRLLRATKNRFGSCEETGVFVMTGHGLEAVDDPSAMLLADRRRGVAGSIVFPGLEGTRPVLVELQTLTFRADISNPRRVAIGLDAGRLALLIGVLSQHASIRFAELDVFAAAAGGLTVREPASDLALCLALFSSIKNRPIAGDVVAVGEVGLAGEVRRVPGVERRLAEARRLGFARAIVPRGVERVPKGLDVTVAVDLAQAIDGLLVADRDPKRTSDDPRRGTLDVEAQPPLTS